MSKYPIHPHLGVGLMSFGATRATMHDLLGTPAHERRSRFSDEVTDFWQANCLQLTFTSHDGLLVEVGLYPGVGDVMLGERNIFSEPRKEILESLYLLDSAPLQTVGITVLLSLGIALTGFQSDDTDQRSVSAFVKGRWRADDPKLKPVSLIARRP